MRFVVGADEDRPVVAFVAARLREKNHDVRVLPVAAWARVALDVAEAVARGEADQGVVCCWTGTGVTIAANKVPGARCALCGDAQTAAGARKWNDANVLALSLRTLSEPVASEIVDAWLAEKYAGTEDESLGLIR
ncbi:MAG TPA: RpiB/LacA/LacB family sugar-phosphate isomerase [Polyangiaceae bacterium]|jgi:ribose 5-phosphate isomerase B